MTTYIMLYKIKVWLKLLEHKEGMINSAWGWGKEAEKNLEKLYGYGWHVWRINIKNHLAESSSRIGKNFSVSQIWKGHCRLSRKQKRNQECMELHCLLEISPTIFHLEDTLLQISILFCFANIDLSTKKYGFLDRQMASDFLCWLYLKYFKERNSEMLH